MTCSLIKSSLRIPAMQAYKKNLFNCSYPFRSNFFFPQSPLFFLLHSFNPFPFFPLIFVHFALFSFSIQIYRSPSLAVLLTEHWQVDLITAQVFFKERITRSMFTASFSLSSYSRTRFLFSLFFAAALPACI